MRSRVINNAGLCYYCYYMKPIQLKVARIGNSRGVRLPAATLKRFGIDDTVVMEERSDGILLRPAGRSTAKLSWEETAIAMAASDEDWSEWDAVAADGLEGIEWDVAPSRSVAERKSKYDAPKQKRSPAKSASKKTVKKKAAKGRSK